MPLPTSVRDTGDGSSIVESLLHRCNEHGAGFLHYFLRLVHRFRRSTTREEEKVSSRLYALAQSPKDLVFEYVRSTERGLSFFEAERRQKENVPRKRSPPARWQLLWNAFFHPFNIILLILSVFSYAAGDSPNGCIMFALVSISVSLRLYQEFSCVSATAKLTEFVRCPVRVQRCAGRVVQMELVVQVDQRDIVAGDIILFQPGDLFPGDVRLLSSNQLVVSQSSLTGESGTMEKSADFQESAYTPLLELKNICFTGTSVMSGCGTGLVVATGSATYMSTLSPAMEKKRPPDAFEGGVRRLSYVLVAVMVVVATLIVLVGCFTSQGIAGSLLFAISMASTLAPQLLPLIVNASLARGALAMAKDRCIFKTVTALRDMGSMDVLCLDKTGTLTVDNAVLVSYMNAWASCKERVLRFAFLNSYFKTEQKYPLDDAILAYVYTHGFSFRPSRWMKLDEIPFDFSRRRVSVILQKRREPPPSSSSSERLRLVVTKGALEEVIGVCSFIENDDQIFSEEDRRRILNIAGELSVDGLRFIGVAMKRLEIAKDWKGSVESNMVFLGLITFFDPPKDSAKEALWRLAGKGVEAKVLTGDTLALTARLCREVGIETKEVTTGPELELLDPDEFHSTVKRATVLARLTPLQKLKVVQSLQTEGNRVVGFLGDGINDSCALDAANVGISVDSGASVAKDSADVILLEKDLNVLVAGVDHGRITFANTMKYIRISVIANVGSVLSILTATVVLGFEPMTARQLLIQSFLYNVALMAIPWDTTDPDFVQKPRKWSDQGFFRFFLWNGPVSLLCDVGTLAFLRFYYYQVKKFHDRMFVYSAFFVEGLLIQTLMIHLMRTEKIPFVQELAARPVLISTVLLSAVGVSIPFAVGKSMAFATLPPSYFCFLLVLFLLYFSVGQLVKRAYIITFNQWL